MPFIPHNLVQRHRREYAEQAAGDAYDAILDALLSELPEEAVEAARDWLSRYAIWSVTHPDAPFEERKQAQFEHTRNALNDALRSLRSSSRGPADGE